MDFGNWGNTGVSFWMEQVCFILRKNTVKTAFAQRERRMMEKRQSCTTIKYWKQR